MAKSHTSDTARGGWQGVQRHTVNPGTRARVCGRKGGEHVRVCERCVCEISVGEACDIRVTCIYAREYVKRNTLVERAVCVPK